MNIKTNKIFKYPKVIYNEQELLDVYKKKFPKIIKEYEIFVKKTYCNPVAYKKIIKEKSKKFDIQFTKIVKGSKNSKDDFYSLLKTSINLHKNYAFNFWLISYATGEGNWAIYYVDLMESILKKLYINDEDSFLLARKSFLKTDFEIFYHKILIDSVKLIDLLKENSLKKILDSAKKVSPEKRILIYDNLISETKKLKKINPWVLSIFERHKNNRVPIYNLFNQGIDYYEENLNLRTELDNTSKIIKQTLRFAKKKLSSKDFNLLKNSYFLVKEIITTRDFIFGRKDKKLFHFWGDLNHKILNTFQKEFGKDISFLDLGDRNFLIIPWVLEKYLPKKFLKQQYKKLK